MASTIKSVALMALVSVCAQAQVFSLNKEQMIAYTAENPFDRFADGRPKVPDELLAKVKGLLIEEAYGVVRGKGFVNQFALEGLDEERRTLVFVSTAIENIAPGWRARETYCFLNNDEFIETFALAQPGKDFATYSETRFRRRRLG